MNIALMANDSKKELMIQFCVAYCGILAGHKICATKTTGQLISESTGLPITLCLSANQGGSQQIGARIAYNEIDLVLFFCDPDDEIGQQRVNEISHLCDRYSIPIATNVATAEILIQGLGRGDLDWRSIVNPPING
ncbi:MAG: methylglyoxal synthase [Oscillospiraceae bacterium]|nr:methylglyoxal synthase [Oscillospiraceae bacterium]